MIGVPTRGLSESDLYPDLRPTGTSGVASAVLSAREVESGETQASAGTELASVTTARSWITANLEPLRRLPHNWDSHGGRPLDDTTARTAEMLVSQLLAQRVAPPRFFPHPDGGLSIEWHRPALELAIELAPGSADVSSASVYFSDELAEVEWETVLSDALPQVGEALGRFLTTLGR